MRRCISMGISHRHSIAVACLTLVLGLSGCSSVSEYSHVYLNAPLSAPTDPAAVAGSEAERLTAFRQVRDALEAQLRSWLETLPAE